MMSWLGLVLLGIVLALFARVSFLRTELFRILVTDGEATLRRGRLPPALFDEIADIAQREHLKGADIRGVLSGGRARLVYEHDGTGAAAEQPLRNVLGRFTLTQLRSGRRRAD